VIASDRVRKRLAGLAPTERATAAPARGIYTSEWNERVYTGLLARAAPVVASGRTAILDATFSTRSHRRRAREAALAFGIPVRLVETRCPTEIARGRLERRAAAGTDASDAGPELHARSVAAFEAVLPEEGIPAEVLDTADPGWRDALARRVSSWGVGTT